MLLEIVQRQVEPDITVVELSGKLALGRESQRIEALADELVKRGCKRVVLVLVRVNHIDSAGVGMVALAAGKLKEAGCQLAVAVTEGRVLDVLNLTRISTIVTVCPTIDAALAAV